MNERYKKKKTYEKQRKKEKHRNKSQETQKKIKKTLNERNRKKK